MSSNARTANASRIRRVVTRKLIAKTSPTSSTVLSDTKLAKYAVRYDSLPSYVQNLYRSSNIELIQHAEKAFIAGTNKTNQNPHKPKKKKLGFNCNSSQIMSQCFVRVLFITISSLSFWRDSTTNSKTFFYISTENCCLFFLFSFFFCCRRPVILIGYVYCDRVVSSSPHKLIQDPTTVSTIRNAARGNLLIVVFVVVFLFVARTPHRERGWCVDWGTKFI